MKIRNVPTTLAIAALLSACMGAPSQGDTESGAPMVSASSAGTTSATPAHAAPPAFSAQAGSAPEPTVDDAEVLATLVALYPPRAAADVILAKILSGPNRVPSRSQPGTRSASRDLGFGVTERMERSDGASLTCVTRMKAYEGRIFQMDSTCNSRHWEQITPKLPAATLAHLSGDRLTLSFDDPNVLAALHAGVARTLGPTLPVTTPPDLSEAYQLLSADFGSVTVGDRCGFGGSQTDGSTAIALLEGADRIDLIRNIARSLNPGGRVFAARVLKRLGDPEDEALVRQIRESTAEIETCGGCIFSRATAADLL